MTTLYRATDGYIGAWSCWSTSRETAEAYTVDGIGHGGATIVERAADLSSCLDLRSDDAGVDLVALASALGYDDARETAAEWRANGWRYPWEDSRSVRARLAESGYAWVVYYDDYPEMAETYVMVSGSYDKE